MLLLQIRQSTVPAGRLRRFVDFVQSVAGVYPPVLGPSLELQASVMGLSVDEVRSRAGDETRESGYDRPDEDSVLSAEMFASDAGLLIAEITQDADRHDEAHVRLYQFATRPDWQALEVLEARAAEVFGTNFEPFRYSSQRFDELKAEGRQRAPAPVEGDISAARLLADRATRTIARAVESSGGLLLTHLPRQIPPEERHRVSRIWTELLTHGLVQAEVVVICRRSEQQIARLPSMQAVDAVASQGLRCTCGRLVSEETIEEAGNISDQGRRMLEGSHWLSILLVGKLQELGIPLACMLVEQEAGSEETDCIADVSGDLVLFELDDKHVNLGAAYAFGAKIGKVRPRHPVIVTSEKVGDDARKHFQRAAAGQRHALRSFYDPGKEPSPRVRYIEGLETFDEQIETLVSDIFRVDAAQVVRRNIRATAASAEALLRSIERRATAARDDDHRELMGAVPSEEPSVST